MLKRIFTIVLFLLPIVTSSQKSPYVHSFKGDYVDENQYYYTFNDDVPPVDTRDGYLKTLIFLYNSEGLSEKTRARIGKEIGYVYYMKHKHESADYYFFRTEQYFELPNLQEKPKEVGSIEKSEPTKTPKTSQEFFEKVLSMKYDKLSPDQIQKLSQDVDKQINKLTSERDSIILSEKPNMEEIKEKNNSIKVLKGTKEHLKSVVSNIKLKFEKGQLKKYLTWALIGLFLLILVIILIIWNIRQKLKIQKQDGEIEQQLVDINTKNTYLEHAARIIRHDMHSGINTYIPRGLSSLERKLNDEDIKKLKLESSLKLIKDGVNHAQKVYKNVYAFTNLVKKDVVLEKTSCDLKEILENHLNTTSYKSDVVVSDLVTVEVDEILFCTAIDNLIRNGLKYNDSANKKVEIFMENDITLVIQDNGKGMSKKEFNKFLKPHESDGLGLNICVAILKEHGFSVDCEKIETGTKIKIKLKEEKKDND